jgi:hypothetical protein
MYFLLFIVLLAAVLAYLIFEKPVGVYFLLDSDEMEMMVRATWLGSIRSDIRIVEQRPHINIFFGNRRIYSKTMEKNKTHDGSGRLHLKALRLSDTKIKTFYGLAEPHLTGILYGATEFIASFAVAAEIMQFPDYVPDREYLRIEAETRLNIGATIVSLISLKFRKRRSERPWIRQT